MLHFPNLLDVGSCSPKDFQWSNVPRNTLLEMLPLPFPYNLFYNSALYVIW